MKIMVIGSSGAGKSTFSKKLSERTGYPLLHLDKIWHETDYSDSALAYFKKVQKQFIAENENCIVDGNYSGTMETRLPSADLIIWLKISRLKALRRVISRSLKTRFAGKNRSDMATNFVEKFDKEYWEFMKFIWNFPKKNEPRIRKIIEEYHQSDKIIIVKSQKEKEKIMSQFS